MQGTVVKTFGRYYTVEGDGRKTNCVLRGKIKQDKSLKRFSDPVAIGDIVDYEINDDKSTGVINGIFPRRNSFSRTDKARGKEDLLAANLDQVVIIQSFKKPKLNLRFVDRLVVRSAKENIPVLLCINKSDMATPEDYAYIDEYYKSNTINILIMSAKLGEHVDELREYIKNKLSIFFGFSGVGKSTIINYLVPGVDLRVSHVSDSTGKGRHTTTNAEIVTVESDTRIVDTPGMREFGIADIQPQELGDYFTEFREYSSACNFRGCTHDHEPKCAVKEQVANGLISEGRYHSYLNILHSIQESLRNMY